MKWVLILSAVFGGFSVCYVEDLSYMILMAVVINAIVKVIMEMIRPKITEFELVPCLIKSNILLILEIAFETNFLLTSITIEEFVNQERLEVKISYPRYDNENKRIQIVHPMTCCLIPSSYRVTVRNFFTKDSSEKVLMCVFFKFFKERCILHDRSSQTMFTSVKRDNSGKTSGIWIHESGALGASPDGFVQGNFPQNCHCPSPAEGPTSNFTCYYRESMDEFTYLNVDPESCSRSQCSGYGFNKCNTCSAPYCSSRCKSKDFRNHRRQCPNLKLEEQQRQQKEQQLESCTKRLREDIERLTDHGLCKICLEEESCVVFDPCGHLCCCYDCSEQLKKCPLCREDVQKPIKVFT